MTFCTNYIRTVLQFKKIYFCFAFLFILNSCNFFEDEFKQDKQLALYRYQMHTVSEDSTTTTITRIKLYKSIVEKASVDDLLITPRKKNMLLSEVYNAISGEYYEMNNLNEAIANSTLSIVLNGTNQHAYYNRAYIYQMMGQDSLAILDYTKAIAYDDKYTNSYYNRGIIYEEHTDFQLAIEDYTNAIKQSPSYIVDVYNNRGNVYQEMQFFTKAIDDYNKALAIDSTLAITYCNRADAYMNINEPEKAILDYKKAYQCDSCNIAILAKIESLKKNKTLERFVSKK